MLKETGEGILQAYSFVHRIVGILLLSILSGYGGVLARACYNGQLDTLGKWVLGILLGSFGIICGLGFFVTRTRNKVLWIFCFSLFVAAFLLGFFVLFRITDAK
jgi:hypothetical protein